MNDKYDEGFKEGIENCINIINESDLPSSFKVPLRKRMQDVMGFVKYEN